MIRALTTLAVILVVAGCQVPAKPASVPLVAFQLKTHGLPAQTVQPVAASGRTVLPTIPAYTFDVLISSDADSTPYNVYGLTDPNPTLSLPEGNYHLQVVVHTNFEGLVIGESAYLPITVNRNSAANMLHVTVSPQLSGTGYIDVQYTWPTERSGTSLSISASLSLSKLPGGEGVNLFAQDVVLESGHAAVAKQLSTGNYYLVLQLTENGHPHPPVGEVVQVYQNLTSSKTTSLDLTQLNGPPVAPVAVGSGYDLGGLFLNWTIDPSTQDGFRVYQNGSLVADITNPYLTNAIVPILPATSSDAVQIAAYNEYGESARTSFMPTTLSSFEPLSYYDLRVEEGDTWSASTGFLKLVWNNPQNDPIDLYRAPYPTGPYKRIYPNIGGESFQDTSVQPGESYYYAFGSGEDGYLIGKPSTNYSYGPGPYTAHLNPIPGVVSGTALAWDGALNRSVPVIGVPYLDAVAATGTLNIIQSTTNWQPPELPGRAVLAGGYTYWFWGNDLNEPGHASLAAFDSEGHFMGEWARFSYGTVSDVQLNGATLQVTLDGSTESVAWDSVATSVGAVVTVTLKQKPTLEFSGGLTAANLNANESEQLVATVLLPSPTASHNYQLVRWQIDGLLTGYGLYVNGDEVTLNSDQGLPPGAHTLTAVIADTVANRIYSIDIPVNVLR